MQIPVTNLKLTELKMQSHGANISEIAKLNGCRPDEILDFSSSINPLGPSKAAEIAIIENAHNISNYPTENSDLLDALASYLEVKIENILIGNGSASLIYQLFSTFGFKKTLVAEPTFSEYKKAAKAFGSKVSTPPAPIGITLDQATCPWEKASAIFVCNPNNPTTELIKREELESLAYKTAKNNTFLIVDEAFMDFLENKDNYTVIDLVSKFENLIVLGSLTKFFALAGLRIGYVCAHPKTLQKLQRTTPPWPISILTAKAALASLKDTNFIKKSRTQIPILRNNLISELVKLQELKAFKSPINFVLVELKQPYNSSVLYRNLAKRKILIRDCASFGMGNNFIRLAVKMPSMNRKLAENISEVLS